MNVIVISALLGVMMMFAGIIFKSSNMVQGLALAGIAVLMGAGILDMQQTGAQSQFFFKMIEMNEFTAWFNVLLIFCCMVYFFLFHADIARVGRNDADYFALMFFILCGAFLLSTYSNLLVLFIGIEILSIPQYILSGSDKESLKSNEASLKYFLMGAFSTGILLMGITLLYGATGSFDIFNEGFIRQFQNEESLSTLSFVGILLMVISFGFKVSAAPLHFWTPDVYDGTPSAFTPFMATIGKVSVFVAFIRLFHFSFGNIGSQWQIAIGAMIALTLLLGNITAVYQQSVKRMMAYSSIAQAGFMLFAIFAVNTMSWKAILLYSVTYSLASMGVFSVMIKMKDYTYEGFNGLARKEPVLAATAAICLLSLAGIPLTGGFFAKYLVLNAAVEQGKWLPLVIFAVIMAAVSAYYYFRLIRSMYFQEGEATLVRSVQGSEKLVLIINAAILILLGVLPGLI